MKILIKNIYFTLRKIAMKFLPEPVMKERSSVSIYSIAVIRIDRIGDVVASLSAIKLLRDIFPKSHIAVVVSPQNLSLLKNTAFINELIPYRGFIVTAGHLRKRRFDLVIDFLMDYPVKTALLAYFCRAKFTAGFDIEGRGHLFNLKFRPSPDKKHVSAYILDLVSGIARLFSTKNVPVNSCYPEFSLLEEDKDYIESFLQKQGIDLTDRLVGIHPGGHYPSQRWPKERFAKLADGISARYNAKVIIIGSLNEAVLINQISKLMKKDAAWAIGLSLDKVASLISLMELFIGNNSGLLHIACLVKTPTISTMGPTDPVLWRPMGENNIVVRKELSCSPCSRPTCKSNDCLQIITVDEMMEAVDRQMKILV